MASSSFDFDQFLAEEGDKPTPQNTGFDFDSFIAEEEGKPTFGNMAKIAGADALKAIGRMATPATTLGSITTTAGDPETQRRLAPYAPVAGGMIGSAVFPGLGTAAGTGLGSILGNLSRISTGDPTAPITPGAAFRETFAQGMLAGVPEASALFKTAPGALSYADRATNAVVDKFGNAAVASGRRALGFTKAFLNKEGGREQANKAAATLLDEGAITPFSDGAKLLENVKGLKDKADKGITTTLDALDLAQLKAFNTSDVSNEIRSQLYPKLSGGEYDKQRAIVEDILATVRAHGDGPIEFRSAQTLKQTLQDLGAFQSQGDSQRAKFFERASGIVREALDKAVEAAAPKSSLGPNAAQEYLRNKVISGSSKDAKRGLTNRLSSDEGNKFVSLTDFIAGGAGGVIGAFGGPAMAPMATLATVGAKRLAERYGGSTAAFSLKKASELIADNGEVINVARRALITRLITSDGE